MEEKKKKLPTVTYLESGEPKTLPPLPGRELISKKQLVAGPQGNVHQITISYSATLGELTMEMRRLRRDMIAWEKVLNDKLKAWGFFVQVPGKMDQFQEEMRQKMEAQAQEVNSALQEVYNALNGLLQGKTEPNGEMMHLILDAIGQQGKRIEALELRMQPRGGNRPARDKESS